MGEERQEAGFPKWQELRKIEQIFCNRNNTEAEFKRAGTWELVQTPTPPPPPPKIISRLENRLYRSYIEMEKVHLHSTVRKQQFNCYLTGTSPWIWRPCCTVELAASALYVQEYCL